MELPPSIGIKRETGRKRLRKINQLSAKNRFSSERDRGDALKIWRMIKLPPHHQDDRALGKRVWKSSRPTHSGVTVIRTMFEIMLRSFSTQALPCSGPK